MPPKNKKRSRKKSAHRHSMTLGLLSDIHWVVSLFLNIINWPFKKLAEVIHTWLKSYAKHHSWIRSHYIHTAITCSIGLCVIVAVQVVEHLSSHPLWKGVVETGRAAGVCPFWEVVASAVAVRRG